MNPKLKTFVSEAVAFMIVYGFLVGLGQYLFFPEQLNAHSLTAFGVEIMVAGLIYGAIGLWWRAKKEKEQDKENH